MSANTEALQGLSCPRCGGMVPIPEGQAVVICPFCDLRSTVKGERGVRRYQVPGRITREQAVQAYQKFLSGSMAIAGSAKRQAQLSEVMLVHLPFWAGWGRGLAWAFGEKQVGSGDNRHYEPREVKVMEDLGWNAAACDVGEFGVEVINLAGRPLEAFNADGLHRSGMVFEPVGSDEEARKEAQAAFESQLRDKTSLDRISQRFTRVVRPRLGIVYYPLWVLRYLYRGRSFQVVVDGFSGEVLYGKAPGNVIYRAAALVGGMAFGSFLAIDLPALILRGSNGEDDSLGIVVFIFLAGLAVMYWGFRTFRYGEHYEYRRYKRNPGLSLGGASGANLVGQFLQQARQINDINQQKR